MTGVRIGVQIEPQHADFGRMQRAWVEAEEAGADTIYTWDHFFPLSGEPDGLHYEGTTSLAAMAAVTQRAEIGVLVICNSYRNPQLLADVHRTIDHISGGRVVLGIGAGWFERDYDEYGYEFGTVGDRLRALARDLPLIRERLGKLNPPPVRDLPILIGGGGEKVTLKLVAEHAQVWHAFGDLDVYRRKAEVLAGHCAAIGRDPSTIEHAWGTNGTSLIDQAPELYAAGVRQFIVPAGGPDYDPGPLRELVAWRNSLR
jgi:probable F420-dependent oxidoreductase